MSVLIKAGVSRKEWFQGGIPRSSKIWFMMEKGQEELRGSRFDKEVYCQSIYQNSKDF